VTISIQDKIDYPPLTVGVVTHSGSFVDFECFLNRLIPAIAHYPASINLLIVNNSGINEANKTAALLTKSKLNDACNARVLPSPENNIATGRNLVLTETKTKLLAFIDDDEYPTREWLTELVKTILHHSCAAVAGPALPVFENAAAPLWIQNLDLHNSRGKYSGEVVTTCATANVLIDLSQTGEQQFISDFGRSGGEDAQYFMSLVKKGKVIRWCNEAVVYETIPENKSTVSYILKRFMIQGEIHKRIMEVNGDISSPILFYLRAFFLFIFALPIGIILALARRQSAGSWIRRSIGNLGKLISIQAKLY